MAHRALLRIMKNVPERQKSVKYFETYLILDFEATCMEDTLIQPQEIIEFPCLALSTKDWKVQDAFHEYVKPKFHPKLTSYCTDLTGIMQETVENEDYFPNVFKKFLDWLENGRYFKPGNESAFVTCGDWDLRVMLPNQCNLYNINIPEPFLKWINLKTGFYTATKRYPRSLKDMLSQLKLPQEGQLHSGIDDAHNMVRIMQELYKRNNKLNFQITSDVQVIKNC